MIVKIIVNEFYKYNKQKYVYFNFFYINKRGLLGCRLLLINEVVC